MSDRPTFLLTHSLLKKTIGFNTVSLKRMRYFNRAHNPFKKDLFVSHLVKMKTATAHNCSKSYQDDMVHNTQKNQHVT